MSSMVMGVPSDQFSPLRRVNVYTRPSSLTVWKPTCGSFTNSSEFFLCQ